MCRRLSRVHTPLQKGSDCDQHVSHAAWLVVPDHVRVVYFYVSVPHQHGLEFRPLRVTAQCQEAVHLHQAFLLLGTVSIAPLSCREVPNEAFRDVN
ncbi:hypothetical protein DPMN_083756 [Dreissena polymorpha]|uniref:Uncharacterized protein n=1 Tax=Dreissena polymorpha TaxID=45954 RepID=A0A9D4BBE8_DREPO|nr:hypothetical protein DPMN_083756 [Dreissena polymorpha]